MKLTNYQMDEILEDAENLDPATKRMLENIANKSKESKRIEKFRPNKKDDSNKTN